MQLEDYCECLGPAQLRLTGHRIGSEHIIELPQEGASADQMALTFPGLRRETIHATITS